MGIDLEYGGNKPLEDLLGSIDHPGDFCTHRRLFAPMPRLEVEGVGVLSFPVPLVQVRPAVVEPQRELAEALPALYLEDGLPGAPAYGVLWRHATERLLARSETPPVAPRDWRIKTNTGCDCAHCADLRAFCRDPDATATRFSMREDLRSHLESEIRRAVLDIDTKTEKKGRPYTLACTKNRASYRRRLAEYAEDVDRMDGLAQAVAGSASAAETARLRQAVAVGRATRVGS